MIEGEFKTGAVLERRIPSRYSSKGYFAGIIDNGVAECLFLCDDWSRNKKIITDTSGYNARAKITFIHNDLLEVDIKYSKTLNELRFINGIYQYRPYNLSDIIYGEFLNTRSFPVDLDAWGSVYITTAVIKEIYHNDTLFPHAFLTNEEGDILFEFSGSYQYSSEIIDVIIEDRNEDGLKDVIFIFHDIDSADNHDNDFEWFFLQANDGLFYNSDFDIDP